MLIGSKVILRRVEEEDWLYRFQWLSDPEVNKTLSSGLGIPPTKTKVKEQMAQYIAEGLTRVDFMILNRENEEPVGFVYLFGIEPWARRAELGIFIGNPSFRGHGYGEQVIRLMLHFAFRRLNLHKVWLTVDDDNQAGKRCYQKAGFREDGRLRDEIYKNGHYVDRILMSILEHEFDGNL